MLSSRTSARLHRLAGAGAAVVLAVAVTACGSSSKKTSSSGASSSTSSTAASSSASSSQSSSAASTGGSLKVAMVPKLLGLPVFEANEKGAKAVAGKLGIHFYYTAPATASATGQVSIFNSLISQHYNVITLSADDPTVPDPVLEKAMKAGIKVVSYDSDVNPAARNFFIQDTAYNTIGEGVINATEKFTGPHAEIAIMSSTPDATIQLAWIKAMKTYIAQKYPGLKIVTIGYGQSVESTSLTQAEDIIRSHPGVKAILPIDGAAVVGTAQAVRQLGDAGKIGVFGIGDPLPNRTYFANGSLQALFLWNEVTQGELTMYVAKLAAENKIHNGSTFTTPLGKYTVASSSNSATGQTPGTIIFSKPLEFTKANYMKYDF